jgi:hypothetical protein
MSRIFRSPVADREISYLHTSRSLARCGRGRGSVAMINAAVAIAPSSLRPIITLPLLDMRRLTLPISPSSSI